MLLKDLELKAQYYMSEHYLDVSFFYIKKNVSEYFLIKLLHTEPSSPKNIEVAPTGPNSLTLKWDPPEQPNGNVTEYKVVVKWEEDREEFLMQRNYCIERKI